MRCPHTSLLLLLSFAGLPAAAQEAQVLLPQKQWTLGASAEDMFLSVMGIAPLADGSLAISDKLSNALVRVDGRGRRVKARQQRGTGPGAFNGPGPVAAWNDILAVADFASDRIQILDEQLSPVREFRAAGSVFSVMFDGEGNLWVGALRGQKGETLFKYDTSGTELLRRVPQFAAQTIFDAIFHLACGRSEVCMVYATRNLVERWDLKGKPQGSFSVSGFPREVPPSPGSLEGAGNRPMPPEILFAGCALDRKGKLALLAGEIGDHPRREVFLVDETGLIDALVPLPERASAIRFDAGNRLITVEKRKTAVSCYRLLSNR